MFAQERLFKNKKKFRRIRLLEVEEVFDDLWLVCKLYNEPTLMEQCVVLCVTVIQGNYHNKLGNFRLSFTFTFQRLREWWE